MKRKYELARRAIFSWISTYRREIFINVFSLLVGAALYCFGYAFAVAVFG